MKKLFLLLIPLSLATSSCTALGAAGAVLGVGDGISASSDKVVLQGTKALAIAADAYAGAASSAAVVVRGGHLSNAQVTKLRELNDKALKLINQADTGLSYAQRAAQVYSIIGELHSVIGK